MATLRVLGFEEGPAASAGAAIGATPRTRTQPNSDDPLIMVPFFLWRAFAPGNQRLRFRNTASTAAGAAASPRIHNWRRWPPRCAADRRPGRAQPGALLSTQTASG